MYGITPEQYYAMLEAQDHKCVTCGISFGEADRDTHVDHNHVTGAVRELLCPPCNQTIGLVKEDTARLRRIADYLDKHAALVRESST
jgi:DNA-directed RNA polymerase subunit RPC12/RpoP